MGSTTPQHPALPTSQFDYVPAQASDSPELVDLFDAAFSDEPTFIHFFPSQKVSVADRAVVRERDITRYSKAFENEEVRYFKLVDRENGKIAAFSKWEFPHTKTPERLLADEEAKKHKDPPVPGSNHEFRDLFLGQLIENRKKYIVGDDMYFLNILAVHPDYQRRGLGTRLIEPVLALADAENRRTYIEATKKGVGLYERLGWVRIGRIEMDNRPVGGKTVEHTVLLMREPKKALTST